MEKGHRSELLEEYYKIAGFVQAYDSYFLSIKAWSVTVASLAIGTGLSKDSSAKGTQVEIFVVALALSLSFWTTEVRFKLLQLAHIYRQSDLEKALQQDTEIQSPRILESFGEGSMADRARKRWRSVILWPHVMFPHVVFTVLSICLIVERLTRIVLLR